MNQMMGCGPAPGMPMKEKEVPRYKPPVGRRSGVGTGTTSLLMIFTVLCFATLAMLSLSTALANQRIQNRGLTRSQDLAAARGLVAEEVAGLDAELLALRAEHDGDEAAYRRAALAAAAARGWQAQEDTGDIMWVSGVDEGNELVTVLRLTPLSEAERYAMLRQSTRLQDGWVPEEGGQLWGGA